MVPKDRIADMLEQCQSYGTGAKVPESRREVAELAEGARVLIGQLAKDRRDALKLLYSMVRHVAGASDRPAFAWYADTARMIADVRELDPEVFDAVVGPDIYPPEAEQAAADDAD
jgi:hypothetical protein